MLQHSVNFHDDFDATDFGSAAASELKSKIDASTIPSQGILYDSEVANFSGRFNINPKEIPRISTDTQT